MRRKGILTASRRSEEYRSLSRDLFLTLSLPFSATSLSHCNSSTTVVVEPRADETGYYMMGIASSGYEKGNILEMISYGAYEVKYWISYTIEGLGQLLTGKVGADQLSGPVGVVDVVRTTYEESAEGGALLVFLNMLRIAILISANLGVMNLLPIPALDGGRLMFLLVELVRGKRVPPEKEGYVHLAGMILLLGLMVFVMFNDIRRLFM